ncbi:bola-like protein [Xylona heveae TC161]|uniref:Bola-like protein n=1 Tax=Xylona heveae (strain CBS 132557 / TC161) TaxID=1328760 RepID=A0A165G2S9_XYLHT|nr:bola-like protein [Xylona heveae TC161]KZF21675.1 bola-like protein [Xylona heveae TC161]
MASSTIPRIVAASTASAFTARMTPVRCVRQLRLASQFAARSSQCQTLRLAGRQPSSRIAHGARSLHATSRTRSAVEPPEYLTEGERQIFDKLKAELEPSRLEVQDISGGCGSMYGIDIVSKKFKGLTMIKQHRLVNQILGDDIKQWHGLQLKTKGE